MFYEKEQHQCDGSLHTCTTRRKLFTVAQKSLDLTVKGFHCIETEKFHLYLILTSLQTKSEHLICPIFNLWKCKQWTNNLCLKHQFLVWIIFLMWNFSEWQNWYHRSYELHGRVTRYLSIKVKIILYITVFQNVGHWLSVGLRKWAASA